MIEDSVPGQPDETAEAYRKEAEGAELMPVIYDELRRLAGHYLRQRGGGGATLQPTAVVHEAYLKLLERQTVGDESRTHFFSLAAQAMRWVIADYARMRRADKRGGGWRQVTLENANDDHGGSTEFDLVALDEALGKLITHDERAARVVQLRFLSGLTIEETAAALGVSIGVVKNEWRWARAWLLEELSKGSSRGA